LVESNKEERYMRIMSLQEFIQQANEPQDNDAYSMVMSNREFKRGLEYFGDDYRIELTIGYPEKDSVCARFFGHDFTYLGD
jgi:hypothetical protein